MDRKEFSRWLLASFAFLVLTVVTGAFGLFTLAGGCMLAYAYAHLRTLVALSGGWERVIAESDLPTRLDRLSASLRWWDCVLRNRLCPRLWVRQMLCRHDWEVDRSPGGPGPGDDSGTTRKCTVCGRIGRYRKDGRWQNFADWPHGYYFPWEKR